MDSETAMDLFAKELLSYDSHVGQSDKFYYNLPYIRNYELTTSIPLTPVSGNIIKFYRYKVDKPVIIFTDVVDTTASEVIDSPEDELYEDTEDMAEDMYDEDGNPRELSDEEMAALLTSDDEDTDAQAIEPLDEDESLSDYDDNEETPSAETDDQPVTDEDAENWEAPQL